MTGQHGGRPIVLGTVRDRANRNIAHISNNGDGILVPLSPDHPDSKLIAAAPELLEACRAVSNLLSGDVRFATVDIEKKITKAIKKAEANS